FLLEGNSGNNAFPRVISKGNTGITNGAFGIFIKDATDPEEIGFRFIDETGTTWDARSTSVPNYDDGEWHHVAATYSNAEDRGVLYIDGMQEAAITVAGDVKIRATTDDLSIGTGNTNRFFNGQVDEVRIWNVARTEQDIREFMCAKLSGSETGLVGYWNMDAAATGTDNVPDLTANALHGTMTSMAANDVITSGAPIGDESIMAYPQDWGGNALDFDGSNDYVDIGDVLLDGLSTFSLEAWIYPTALITNAAPTGHNNFEGAIMHKSGAADDNMGLSVTTGGLAFYIDNGSNNSLTGSTPALNTWTHVAATYDGTTMTIYQNGVLDASMVVSGSGALISNTNPLRIGGGHAVNYVPYEFTGRIDEVRVWNTLRSAGEITNDMCRSLEGDETGLIGYWRLDELTNSGTAADAISGNDGTLTNMDATTDWVTADHSCDYTNFDLYLASPQQDSLRVSAVSGTPDGIHLYYVADVPNSTTGITGLGQNNVYFGVWKAGGTSPTYTATYHFAENDAWQNTVGTLPTNLRLFLRDNNATTTWTDATATLDGNANTLSEAAVGTEFILGITPGGGALPIVLIDFQAWLDGDRVQLQWATASEVNNDFFVVEKSVNGQQWEPVLVQPGAGNTSQRTDYSGTDPHPFAGTSYYRLKQVDVDGQYSYSEVRTITLAQPEAFTLFPNPTNGLVKLTASHALPAHIVVLDARGKPVTGKVAIQRLSPSAMALNLASLPAGFYVVRAGNRHSRLLKLHE
ncbi:MAG: LamG-like jellyroll fold domain-containing protein, partial [Bacteroidota bacterium]